MDLEFEASWNTLVKKISEPYGEALDVQAILFLIGVQELGQGFRKFSKDQKLDVMHIAVCTLLGQYGYYEYEGMDGDGWPHWKATEKLPHLKPLQQNHLMRQAIVEYFKKKESEN
ncbi:MAG: hypothetical protein IPP32_04720 [Bacteroidetes bacterium]|nr:hypothetical protein [Bacteroidota bacterium]